MNKKIHYFTDRFKQFRKERDWTQTQMAQFLELQLGYKISRQMIKKWEDQERKMTAITAIDVAKILSIPVDELVRHG